MDFRGGRFDSMVWLLYCLWGAISVALINSFFRANPFKISVMAMVLLATPATIIGTQFGFGNSFKLAPSFFAAWFAGSALSAISGLLCSVFIFNEPFEIVNVLGVTLILIGGFLIIR